MKTKKDIESKLNQVKKERKKLLTCQSDAYLIYLAQEELLEWILSDEKD